MSGMVNQLLDFGFLELDMLLGNRVIFALHHFLGHGAAVFLGYIKETGVSRALQLDLDGCGFCHWSGPVIEKKRIRPLACGPKLAENYSSTVKSQAVILKSRVETGGDAGDRA